MPIDPELRDRIVETAHQRLLVREQMDEQLEAVVMEARNKGGSYGDIAKALGVSKQAVMKRWGDKRGGREKEINTDQETFPGPLGL